jgi:GNAT superfamily N-acetyltransferase
VSAGPAFRLRAAVPEDASEIALSVALGFETYRSFAPPGWCPPAEDEERLRERLEDPRVWVRVAEHGGEMAGHVGYMPASIHPKRDDDPGLAHFWQLFVRVRHWGTGLATELHGAAVQAATAAGFREFRLFTPLAQGRARRFYEREGWHARRQSFLEPVIGLELLEYRRELSGRAPPNSPHSPSRQ